MQKKYALFLSIIITGIIASNIFLFSHISNPPEKVIIARVIDGDTMETQNSLTIRLENINAPEKNEPGYEQAKNFLKTFENQTLIIEKTGQDKYGRTLAKLYTPEYLNLEIIRKGLATKFMVHQTETSLFFQAEAQAISTQQGMWKKSPYANCVTSKIDPEKEIITLTTNCNISLKDWVITDESRKRYKFPELSFLQINLHTHQGNDNQTDLFWNSKNNIWNNDRDTLYLFDNENNLAHYKTYGY